MRIWDPMHWICFAASAALLLAPALAASDPLDRVYEGGSAPASRTPSALRIVDWNIERGKHLDRVAETLRAQEPDLVLLQEVDLNARRSGGVDVAAELARRLNMNYSFAPAFEEVTQKNGNGRPALQGQAILARGTIRSTRVLRYRQQTGFWRPRRWLPNWAILQRRNGGRIAIISEVVAGDRVLAVYNLHLESRGFGHTRNIQLEETLADARRYPDSTTVIIGGDLNPKYDPARARRRVSREGFQNCMGDRNVRTHVLWGYLDYLFVRGPAACSDSDVIRGSRASDHDPIAARLVFSSESSR
jgi:endonuclease/exonuclease/phosphatase family metal-dependent hydrolase